MKKIKYLLAFLLAMNITACGGGSSQPNFQSIADWLTSIEVKDGKEPYTAADLQTLSALYLTSREKVGDAELEKYVSKLTTIKVLTLDGTKVTSEGVKHLKSLVNLEYLQLLSLKGINGQCIDALSSLPALERLQLGGTGFQTQDIALLAQKLPNLKTLNISKLNVNGAMSEIGKMKNLKDLSLHYTDLNDDGLKQISQLTTLESLSLMDTQVTDQGMEALENLTQLTMLNLMNTKITDKGLDYLKNMTKLGILQVGQTAITDEGLTKLAANTALWSLSVFNTKVTDAGMEQLKAALPKIKIQK